MINQHSQFSNLVCNQYCVREAFTGYGAMQSWWHLILRLHGKPVNVNLSDAECTNCIANGFRFYAMLYRSLAILFLLLALLLFRFGEVAEISPYASGAVLLGGLYLWIVSALGFKAANAYRHDANARFALIGFMVMIVAFLAAFVAAISLFLEQLHCLYFVPNLGATALLFVFGLGSYLIEILYLAAHSNS